MPIHTLSDVVGNAGGKIEYVCSAGNKYVFGYLDLLAMSKFESAILQKDVQALKSLKGTLTDKEYESMQSSILGKWFEGEYVFGGKRAMAELSNLWGISNVLSIISGITPTEANTLIQNNEDLKEVIKIVIEKSFPLSKKKREETLPQTGPS